MNSFLAFLALARLRTAAIAAVAAAGEHIHVALRRAELLAPEVLHGNPGKQQRRRQQQGEYVTGQHNYAPSPAKPMNVSDRMPAIINALAVPDTKSGIDANSSFSRMPAISTSASVKPTPAPSA